MIVVLFSVLCCTVDVSVVTGAGAADVVLMMEFGAIILSWHSVQLLGTVQYVAR